MTGLAVFLILVIISPTRIEDGPRTCQAKKTAKIRPQWFLREFPLSSDGRGHLAVDTALALIARCEGKHNRRKRLTPRHSLLPHSDTAFGNISRVF